MTGWLLDTNILSELRRPRPHRKVVAFVAEQPLEQGPAGLVARFLEKFRGVAHGRAARD